MTIHDPRPVIFVLDASVDITGALRSVCRQATLLSADARFVLVLPNHSSIDDAQLGMFDRVLRLPIRPLRKRIGSAVGYLPALIVATIRLRRAMRRDGAERLQVNDFYLMHGWLLRRFGFRGLIVTWVRIDPTRFGVLGRVWLAATRHSATHLVAVSYFIARLLPAEARAEIVYDPVVAAGPPVLKGADCTARDLVFVGNYIDGKGQDVAIQAFHRIADRFPQTHIVFHGGDMGLDKNRRYKADLRASADSGPGGARIRLEPFADKDTPVFVHAIAAINLSRSESFSLTCQEASAAGLPVIASRCGGPEEIIVDGETGFLVPVDDVAATAQAMTRILEDPDAAARMGRAGAELTRVRFSPETFRMAFTRLFAL